MQLISSAGTETVARLLGFGVVTLAAVPRPAPAAASTTRRCIEQRGRGAAALRGAVADAVALGGPRRRVPRRHHPGGLEASRCSTARPTATSATSRTPTGSTCGATSTVSSRSGTARTSASAPRWRGIGDARRAGRDAEALPHVGDRRVAPRVRAHRDRARLQDGADEGAVSAATSAQLHSARRSSRSRARSARRSPASTSRDLDDATVAEIRRVWLEHLVVFFRDQELDADAFLAFARGIGEPVRYPFVKGIDGYPEIIAVTKLPHETVNFGGIWHSDTVYLERPPMAHDAGRARGPARRRRHDVREHVRGVRRALAGDAASCSTALRAVNSSALADVSKTREDRIRDSGRPTSEQRVRRPSTRSCARTRRPGARRCTSTSRTPRRFAGMTEEESRPLLAVPVRALGPARVHVPVPVARSARSRCGTTAARCTTRSTTTTAHTRAMHRITLGRRHPRLTEPA